MKLYESRMTHPTLYVHYTPTVPNYNITCMKFHISVFFLNTINIDTNDPGQAQVSIENLH